MYLQFEKRKNNIRLNLLEIYPLETVTHDVEIKYDQGTFLCANFNTSTKFQGLSWYSVIKIESDHSL